MALRNGSIDLRSHAVGLDQPGGAVDLERGPLTSAPDPDGRVTGSALSTSRTELPERAQRRPHRFPSRKSWLAMPPSDDARLWHPWLRINRLLRAMLHERWSPEAWPQVKAEFKKALALRVRSRRV